MTHWLVASLKPPWMKAMIPWEGAADMYRDLGYHGGIFSFGFATNWWNNHMAHHLLGKPQASATDAFSTPWLWDYMRNSLDGEWRRGRPGPLLRLHARPPRRAARAGQGPASAAAPPSV